jgi:hypothetical protein
LSSGISMALSGALSGDFRWMERIGKLKVRQMFETI